MLGLGSRALGAVSPRITPLPCFSIMRAAAVMVMKYDLTLLKAASANCWSESSQLRAYCDVCSDEVEGNVELSGFSNNPVQMRLDGLWTKCVDF
jgi:hypothetical protein